MSRNEEYSDLEYATRLDGTVMPAPRVVPNEFCWCGGEVGARVPGDHLGLGCLANITHDWNACSAEGERLMEIESIVMDELAGLGGLGLRVIDSAAEKIARKVWVLYATEE